MQSAKARTRRTVIRGIIGSSIVTSGVGARRSRGESNTNENLYIILAGGTGLREKLREKGCEIIHELAKGSVVIASGPAERENKLRSLSVVSDVIPNREFVADDIQKNEEGGKPDSDPLSEKQWDKHLMNVFDAHDIATGDGTSIAIIDTGVAYSHPDLEHAVDIERSREICQGQFTSGRKLINVRKNPMGWLPATKELELPAAFDVDGHGSHVAGIVAASRNGDGITGVAPDTTVIPLRIGAYQKNDYGYLELRFTAVDLLLAIEYAVKIEADVANLSLVLGPLSAGTERRRYFAAVRRLIQHAIEQGTVIVVAGGNQGVDLEENPLHVLPSSNRGVISVASTGPNDRRYYNSNYGGGVIDVAAPGGGYETPDKTFRSSGVEWPYPTNQILSTVPETIYSRKYQFQRGTSMAAPQVAGLVCLIRELEPEFHPRRVKQVIERSAVDSAGSDPSELGAGRIAILNTVNRLVK
ncbi:Subtilase family protein [Halomicrobium zhouii]|uniref:Subtilase family protein n=1 Tax=Halomicrobium zhouii TaxID=767519 RepID=A0A1I6M222_9EURY|nr:S8 family serine peptidase [Halomicrobium zhouii]SFS09767.1 Subtilase family protein [Halomicrobium zhouii]